MAIKNLMGKRNAAVQKFRNAMKAGQDISLESADELFSKLKDIANKNVGGIDEEDLKKNMGKKLRDYLSADELLNFSWLFITAAYSDSYRKNLGKYGNMTKEEHKNLKTAITYLENYVRSVMSRLSQDQKDRVFRKLSGATIKIYDPDTMDRIAKETIDLMDTVAMDRYDAEGYMDIAYRQMCKNCGKDFRRCELHRISSELLMPESTYCLPNCPYAYPDTNNKVKISTQIDALIEMRKERVKLAEDPKHSREIKDMLWADVDALNKAIEVMVAIKNSDEPEEDHFIDSYFRDKVIIIQHGRFKGIQGLFLKVDNYVEDLGITIRVRAAKSDFVVSWDYIRFEDEEVQKEWEKYLDSDLEKYTDPETKDISEPTTPNL